MAAQMDDAATENTPSGIRWITDGLARGDEAAFHEFHDAYFDRLLRYLIVVTRGDEQSARDALQETLTRVVRHARRFTSEEAFWGWLTLLARQAAADQGRKRLRYWRLIQEYTFFWRTKSEAESADPSEDALFERRLEAALKQLHPKDRQLIYGKYWGKQSVRELADAFQLTEKAVESRLLRARRQLRELFLKMLEDE